MAKVPVTRLMVAIAGGALIFWGGMHVLHNAFLLFPIAGVAIALVYFLDVPQWLFSAIDAARHKVQGVEHAGRHEWYGFHGRRVRVFLDESGAPWFAANEIAAILGGRDSAEAEKPDFAGGEKCVSVAGLRRMIKYSDHPEASALGIWLEREVLFPLQRAKRR